ncbi:hypothetical protein [Tateyamaria sp.]|uniref:hypothetical protein n=1 Tax=Tateyamaria sp. TaxID=1929288 RepID=UPI00329C656D
MKTTLLFVSFVVVLGLAAVSMRLAKEAEHSKNAVWKYTQFLSDAAGANCLRKEALIQAAIIKTWEYEVDPIRIFPSDRVDGFETSLRVLIDPPLPFLLTANKGQGETFYFDKNGCWMR